MRFVSWFPLLVVLALPSAARAENSALAEVDCWFEAPAHVTVECYRLTVPETRDFDLSVGPGQTLSLPVAIIRAGKGARPDPVVYLAGGPGDGAWLDPDRVEWWWEFVANTEWPRQRYVIVSISAGLRSSRARRIRRSVANQTSSTSLPSTRSPWMRYAAARL